MENEESWNTFVHTGKVSDYLEYAKAGRSDGINSVKEERGQREGTSNGNGTVSRYHW